MSNQTVGELNIEVNVQLTKMQAQFDDMARRTKALNAKVNSEFRGMANMAKSFAGTLGIALAPAALIAFGKSVIDLGGKINDLSNQAGINSTAFQALSFHFMDSGVSGEELTKALVKLRKATQEAKEGNKAMQQSFATLGLDPAKLQTLALERQLETLAVSVSKATDQNAAFNAALDILGAKSAPKLLAALKDLGVVGLDSVSDKMESFILTPEEIAAIDAAGDALTRYGVKFKAWAAIVFTKGLAQKGDDPRDIFHLGSDALPAIPGAAEAKEREAFNAIGAMAAANAPKSTWETAPATGYNYNTDRPPGDFGLTKSMLGAYDTEIEATKNDLLKNSYRDLADEAKQAASDINIDFTAVAKTMKLYRGEVTEAAKTQNALTDFFQPLDDLSEKNAKSMEGMTSATLEFADTLGRAFEESIIQGKNLGDVFGSLANSIVAMAIKMMVINPILNGLFGGVSGWSVLPSLFSFGGKKAAGGPVSGGKTYLVGEEGPELFTPKGAGAIIPNHALGGGSGRGSTYNIDARGADRTGLASLEAMIRSLNGSIEYRAVAAVADSRRRGAMA